MIFAEPARTKFDVQFRLGQVPVRIHPFFWVSTLGLSVRPGATFLSVGLWAVAVLVSILVHELGHALVFKRYGREPRITLYGFGGLASADEGRLSARAQIFISAAGPFAGFAFAAIVTAVLLQLGYQVPLLRWTLGSGRPLPSLALDLFVVDLMAINVIWGLVNLLPVHPLDGGQIAYELACARDPVHGAVRSLWLSFFVAVVAAVVGLGVFGDTFTPFLFGYLAFMSWRVLSRRYGVGFGSLAIVRWARGQKRALRSAPTKRASHLRVARDVREIDEIEGDISNPEIDRVVGELFESVAREARHVPTGGPGKRVAGRKR